MTRGVHIARWRDQVKADHRLCTIDFTVAYQLSERTSADEFARSGDLVTWQGVALLATETGVCERTVQRSVGRLQEFGHIAVKLGGGRHRSNGITLILKAVASFEAVETVTAVSPFPRQNPDTGDGVSD